MIQRNEAQEALASAWERLAGRHLRGGEGHSEADERARARLGPFMRRVFVDNKGHALRRDGMSALMTDLMEWHWQRQRHLSIATPPGLYKSTTSSALAAFAIGHNPSIRIVATGAVNSTSSNTVSRVRQIVNGSAFRHLFPGIVPDHETDRHSRRGHRMGSFFVARPGDSRDPTMHAVPVLTNQESLRVDMLLADDIVTEAIARSKAKTKAVTDAFFRTWLEGRLALGGWCLTLQNPRRLDDLAHKLRDDRRFTSLWIVVNSTCDGFRILGWNVPEDFPLRDPEKARRRYGTEFVGEVTGKSPHLAWDAPLPRDLVGYRAEDIRAKESGARRVVWQGVAFEDSELAFPAFSRRPTPGRTPGEILRTRESESGIPMPHDYEHQRMVFTLGLDISSRKRRGTVLVGLAKDYDRNWIVPWFTRRYGDTSLSAVLNDLRMIHGLGVRWSSLRVESVGVQDRILAEMRQLARNEPWAATLRPFETGLNKLDPSVGLLAMASAFEAGENGGFVWPSGMASRDQDWALLEDELATLGRFAETTPDGPMAFWFAYWDLRAAQRVAPGSVLPVRIDAWEPGM